MTQVNPEHMDMDDDILISYLLGEASTAEIKQVDLQRRTDEAYNKRFEAFKLLWETSKNLEDTQEADKQASLKRFKEKVVERKVTNTRIIKLKQRNIWMTIAASLMFIAGGAWLYYNQFIDHQMRFETQGIVKTDTLPDGSRITLNKYALLSYPEKFSGDQRNVTLVKGEGFFNITPNKAKPFIITTGKTTIRVVGTSFNVKNKNGLIEVIVETGIVQVSNSWNNTMTVLKPGETALVNPQTSKIIKLKTPDNLYAYFRSDEFVFKNVTLYRLVQVLNEAYNSHIIIDKSVSKDQIMTGSLKTKDPLDVILNVISAVLNIRVEKTSNQIILKK